MIGAVLYQELLLASRRTRQYVFRWIYAGWMILQLLGLAFIYVWQTIFFPGMNFTILVCTIITPVLIVQQFILLALTTPVFGNSLCTQAPFSRRYRKHKPGRG